jgi:hypothetical protein
MLGALEVRGDAERVRADQNADGQIAEHRRQVQRAKYDHADHRSQQQQQRHFEREIRRSVLVRRGHGNAGAGGGGRQAASDKSEGAARRTNAFAILRA